MIFVSMFAVWFFGAGLWSLFILPKGGKVGENGESTFCILSWCIWALAQMIFLGWLSTLNWSSAEFLLSSEGYETSLVLTLIWFDMIWGRASTQIWRNVCVGLGGMIHNAFENIFFKKPPSKVARRKATSSEEW